jgi:hypothetical protein
MNLLVERPPAETGGSLNIATSRELQRLAGLTVQDITQKSKFFNGKSLASSLTIDSSQF